jgi:hypothetical protein
MTDQRVRTSGTILWYSGTARPVLDFSASHPLAPRHNMLSAHSTRVRPRKTETATCSRALHLIAVHILAHPAERRLGMRRQDASQGIRRSRTYSRIRLGFAGIQYGSGHTSRHGISADLYCASEQRHLVTILL